MRSFTMYPERPVIRYQSEYRAAVKARLPERPTSEQIHDAVEAIGREHSIGSNARIICNAYLVAELIRS